MTVTGGGPGVDGYELSWSDHIGDSSKEESLYAALIFIMYFKQH